VFFLAPSYRNSQEMTATAILASDATIVVSGSVITTITIIIIIIVSSSSSSFMCLYSMYN
jgi:hypothetical protein